MDREQVKAQLESLLDSPGMTVPALLYALAEVCGEKAEHIQTNWQDSILARAWEDAGARVDKLADKMARL